VVNQTDPLPRGWGGDRGGHLDPAKQKAQDNGFPKTYTPATKTRGGRWKKPGLERGFKKTEGWGGGGGANVLQGGRRKKVAQKKKKGKRGKKRTFWKLVGGGNKVVQGGHTGGVRGTSDMVGKKNQGEKKAEESRQKARKADTSGSPEGQKGELGPQKGKSIGRQNK